MTIAKKTERCIRSQNWIILPKCGISILSEQEWLCEHTCFVHELKAVVVKASEELQSKSPHRLYGSEKADVQIMNQVDHY